MKKIIVLGEKGMLGNAVYKYFSQKKDYVVFTTSARWGSVEFRDFIIKSDADVIINCIGKIPQRKPITDDEYVDLNENLPTFLENKGVPVIHPSTDCEFSGKLDSHLKYLKNSKRDAVDSYGKSKARISEKIEYQFKNTKIIRTSIIGHELGTHVSLLDWFLATTGVVKGYNNHYWNGITTLQWAKLAEYLILNWKDLPKINQFGTADNGSKFDLLTTIKRVYDKKDVNIEPFNTEISINKCLESDIKLPDIYDQLVDLRDFYKHI